MSERLLDGRYVLGRRFARGGAATLHWGLALSPARLVAIKRLRISEEDEDDAKAMVDEGRLASRIHHFNVAAVYDVLRDGDDLFIVMEYVSGVPLLQVLKQLRQRGEAAPPSIVSALGSQIAAGLHAAHEARDERGRPLSLIHRDVSPHNIMVGADGHAKVIDFGIAKAEGRLVRTRTGLVKGKVRYMAFEQASGMALDRRVDVYALCAVLWELLAGRRLYGDADEEAMLGQILRGNVEAASAEPGARALCEVLERGLSRRRNQRFDSCAHLGEALELAAPPAPRTELTDWLAALCAQDLKTAEAQANQAEAEARAWQSSHDSEIGGPTEPTTATERIAARVLGARGGLLLGAGLILSGAALAWWQTASTPSRALRHGPASLTTPQLAAPLTGPVERGSPSAATPSAAPPGRSSATAPRPAPKSAPAPRIWRRPAPRPTAQPAAQDCRVLGDDGIWRIKPACR